jgi:fructose-bisphosphate aldolase class II
VFVEAELGALAGFEDENTNGESRLTPPAGGVSQSDEGGVFTNPSDAKKFVELTGCDSLAIAIGTSHGAYKRHNDTEELRFDILEKIARDLPGFPLVLHGASTIPQDLVKSINENGGDIGDARGIPAEQIRRAIKMGICKVNVDSDARLAWTAAVRKVMYDDPTIFDPRKFLIAARDQMSNTYADLINNVMHND